MVVTGSVIAASLKVMLSLYPRNVRSCDCAVENSNLTLLLVDVMAYIGRSHGLRVANGTAPEGVISLNST